MRVREFQHLAVILMSFLTNIFFVVIESPINLTYPIQTIKVELG